MAESASIQLKPSPKREQPPVPKADVTLGEGREELVSRLTSYLAQLGLKDEHLSKVMSLLEAMDGEGLAEPEERDPIDITSGGVQGSISLYIAEEQPILNEAYQSFFREESSIQLVGAGDDTETGTVVEAAQGLKPQVVVLGVKRLQTQTVEKLESIREGCPGVGLVLLFAFFDGAGVRALREFARDTSGGRAYLLKHTIDTVEQLTQVVHSVAQGRVIIDPMVMEQMIQTQDTDSGFLRELSPRALEVLSWMAKGYRNEGIAEVLTRDVKTIERHINHIYTTLQGGADNAMHPRVQAALTYLRATGLLSTEQTWES